MTLHVKSNAEKENYFSCHRHFNENTERGDNWGNSNKLKGSQQELAPFLKCCYVFNGSERIINFAKAKLVK